jgi:hypothetical protein
MACRTGQLKSGRESEEPIRNNKKHIRNNKKKWDAMVAPSAFNFWAQLMKTAM